MLEQSALSLINRLQSNMEKTIFGKPEAVQSSIITLLAKGHLLIEDVPGVGKTTLAQTLARSIDLEFRRIQFTNDILPSDITGVSVYDPEAKQFIFKKGPLFSNIVLADEINRATPRTQSALLEAMSERQVSSDNVTHALEEPFMVIATQNPVESHGAYPLPESQMDRFMMFLSIGYPTLEDEKRLLESTLGSQAPSVESVVTREELLLLQSQVEQVTLDESLAEYLLALVHATRQHKHLALGVSPRGGLTLRQAARAKALTEGRTYCLPDDVKSMALPVFKHRVMLSSQTGSHRAQSENAAAIIMEILDQVEIPV
ncbi:MAG: MoxR family ATPase [Candidatus Nitrohelix vancouverensis]|uniref:MoxR family ATPase n=1 Tax=Candidatus Nitrohelix vancouverensis TaxID=2705534 RepID=A0A7T0C435_9BACT|nr:MAG: MoxR family ATPase [Candidatus Nitrohelix vancouverensis]